MRQRSIVGPVLVIGLGALLLINNLNFDLDLSRFIGTYWPLLLILAGVAKLGENLTGYSKTHPASKICNPRGTV